MKKIAFIISILFVLPMIVEAQSYKKQIKQHRKAYKKDFLADERAPLGKKDLKKMHFFNAEEKYLVQADFTLTPDAKPFKMATYSGITRDYISYGTISFTIDGKEFQLSIYRYLGYISNPMYKDHLFLPFKDWTNDEESYGGGRYLDLKMSDIVDQKISIDFNKAYNPWCAYSDGYNCPVPPRENHLAFALEAGERKFKGIKKSFPRQEI